MVKGEKKERRRIHVRSGSDDSSSSSLTPATSDEEDDESLRSGSSSIEEVEDQQLLSALQQESVLLQAFDDLAEKKHSIKREQALASMQKTMSSFYLPHLFDGRIETIVQSLLMCIRRGGQEQQLALDALAVMAVTVLDGNLVQNRPGSLGETVLNMLTELAFSAKGHVRASAIQTYSFWHFLGTHEPGDILVAMKALYDRELYRPRAMTSQKTRIETTAIGVPVKTVTTPQSIELGNEVLTAALRGWGLMASALPNELRETLLTPNLRRDFNTFLTREFSVNVRMAAGENMALLYESYYQLHRGSGQQVKNAEQLYYESQGLRFDDNDNTNDDSKSPTAASSGESLSMQSERDAIVVLLDDILNESNKSKSKKDRTKQRSLFRDILETIQFGISPSVVMKVKGRHITFPTWMSIIRLNYFRDVLGHGITSHFKQNYAVREIFQIDINFEEKLEKLSKEHKKLLLSDTSPAKKERTVRRSKQSRDFHTTLQEPGQ